MRPMMASLFALAVVLAGCLGGGDDGAVRDGSSRDDGTNDGTNGGGAVEGDTTDDATSDGSRSFEPETHTWDGVIPVHVCIGSDADGTCVVSPLSEDDDANTFEVPEGASLASFDLTWDGDGALMVHVSGDPTVEEGEHQGTSPLQVELPLDGSGTLAVSVFDETTPGTGHIQGRDWPFHMELIVS